MDDIFGSVRDLAEGLADDLDFVDMSNPEQIQNQLKQLIGIGSNLPNDNTNDADVLKTTLDKYNEKYGLDLDIKSFSEHLSMAAFVSKKDREILGVVQKSIISNSAEYLYFKSLVSVYQMIDRTIQNALHSEYMANFSMESFVVIDRLFSWLQKLEELKSKYKVHNLDSTMSKLLETEKEIDTTELNKTYSLVQQLAKMN